MKKFVIAVMMLSLPVGASAYSVAGLPDGPLSVGHAGRVAASPVRPIILAENGAGGERGEGRNAGGLFSLLKWLLPGEDDDGGQQSLATNPGAVGKVPPPDNGLIKKGAKPVVIK